MSLAVRSDDRPVAAKYVATVALSPEVEKCGLVLPSLNRPHSGCPFDPQPCGFFASANRSLQPIGLPGHPSASAIGRGIATTSGVCARLGSSSGTRSARSAAVRSWRSSTAHDDAAGLHTSGRGPSTVSSHPRASACSAPPLALLTTDTWAQPAPTGAARRCTPAAIPWSSAAFSLLAARVTTVHDVSTLVAALGDATETGSSGPDAPVNTARAPSTRSRPTTAATTIGTRLRRASDTVFPSMLRRGGPRRDQQVAGALEQLGHGLGVRRSRA